MELDNRMKCQVSKIAETHNLTDYNLTTDAGSALGDNYLGTIIKIKLSEVKTGKVLNLILKSATANPEIRDILPIEHIFAREVYFYETVLPTYNQLLEEHNQQKLSSFPDMLGYDLSIPEFLIMTDMKSQGYVMRPDRAEPLDFNHVKMVLKEYGRFHGLYFALKALKPKLCKEISANMSEAFYNKMADDNPLLNSCMDVANDRVMKSFHNDEHDAEAMDKFEKYAKCAKLRLRDDLKDGAAGRFEVINHGDGWANNMLFKYDNEELINLCLLDFQLSRLSSPALELSYFIYTCTDQAFRDEYFELSLKYYHESMKNTLENFSLDLDDFLTSEELNNQMQKFSTFGLFMTIEVMHLMLSDTAEIPDYEVMMEKDGLEDTLAAFSYESKNEGLYRKRIRSVVLDFVQRGYL